MLATTLLFLAASGVWSLLLTCRLAPALTPLKHASVSGALWLALLCWTPFGLARIVGLQASGWVAALIFVALVCIEYGLDRIRFVVRCRSAAGWLRSLTRRENRVWALAGLVFLGLHAAGHVWHCLRDSGGSYWSAGAGWEDQSFHTALATSFALGDNLTRLSYPHVPNWPLGYPFLPDFQAGWLYAQGFSLPMAFVLGNVIASAVFLLGAWCLLSRWLESRGAALLALVLWHVGGGWGIFYLFFEWSESGSFFDALWAHDYANDWSIDLHFHNLTTAILWPMRVVLFGLAISFALVVLLRDLLSRTETSVKGFLFAGAIAGTLPLISAHALVVLVCVTLPMALFNRPWARLNAWLAAAGIGAIVSLPQILWIRHQLGQSDPAFVRPSPGWMTGWWGDNPGQALLVHWAWNTGLWITLGFVGWCFAGRRFRRETVGWWLIFPLGYLMVFQPYVFDNLKLFASAALAAAAGCAMILTRAWTSGRIGRWAALLLFPLLTASGIQSILSEARAPAIILDAEARRFAERVNAQLPRDALVLTGPQLNHPVLLLAGRRVVAANPSGLTLHGVPKMLDHTDEVARIFRGAPDADELLRRIKPGWIVVGPMERVEFRDLNSAYLERISEPLFHEGAWELRRVRAGIVDP